MSVTEVEQPVSQPQRAKPSVLAAFKRGIPKFAADGGTDLAASLTYFAVLSLFPALLAMISILGLLGPNTIATLLDIVKDMGAPESSIEPIETFITNNLGSGGAGVALVIGVAGALYAASNYVNAFSRSMNKVYGVEEGRPIWTLRPWIYGITVVMAAMVLLVAAALVITPSFAASIADVVGLGSTVVFVWNLAKWPVVVAIVMGIVSVLYWATPNVRPKYRLITVGSAFALVVWALATALLGLYVGSGLATYNETYGAFAGVIILLLWLWVTNIVLLIGAEVDVEMERSRQLQAGVAAEEQIQLPLRNRKGVEKKLQGEQEKIEEARRVRIEAAEERNNSTDS
ncbi:MAG: YihY/virulence factor BrkB family protein [Ornithinimicrobium sp.]